MEKVNKFFSVKQAEFWAQFNHLEEFLKNSQENGLSSFGQFCKDLEAIRYFVVLNYMAVLERLSISTHEEDHLCPICLQVLCNPVLFSLF